MVLTLRASNRILTKVTLIPLNLVIRLFFLFKKKKLIWKIKGQRIFSEIRLVSDSSPKIWRAYWAALHQIESAFLLKHFYLLIKKKIEALKKGVYLNKEKMFPICCARPINWFAPPITLLKFSPEP